MVKTLENISLKPYNTFGIDHYAQYFHESNSPADLIELLQDPKWNDIPKLILGGGSNMLLCTNFQGLVIKINFKGITHQEHEDTVSVTAQAGEVWHDFVLYCVNMNWAGVENLSLIPGCIGAAPIQNIGAYGVEVKDLITNVKALDIKTLEIKEFTAQECAFGYRESIFKNQYKNKFIILEVTFLLHKNPKINSSYGAINDILKSKNIANPTIKDISDAVIAIRSSKLPDPKKIGNAGSFFKNPEVVPEVYENIKKQYPDVPSFQTHTELIKIPAGWLIEKAGWKGKSMGNYGVHKDQALVIVNYGGAHGNEIKQLARDIQNDIFEKFKIMLQNEVNYIE